MTEPWLIGNARIVADDRIIERGWLRIDGGVLVDLGDGDLPKDGDDRRVVDAAGRWVLPGYIDVHVHGGGGASFSDGRAAAVRAARFHGGHGTTSLLAGLSTAPWPAMRSQVAEVADLVEVPRRVASAQVVAGTLRKVMEAGHSARILGSYLEGPFLSAARKGAHDPDLLMVPTESSVAQILSDGGGTVAVATVAPEIRNGLAAIEWLTASGVRVSLGHTDADGDAFAAGLSVGGSCLTHTFNGMRPPTHRDPAVLEPLADGQVAAEVICDGLHVHPVLVRALRRLIGPDRLILITDAVAWAGRPGGLYRSEGRAVEVRDGRVLLAGTDTLAGSCLTMEAAVQNYVTYTGADPVEVAKVSSTNAAVRLGLDDIIGRIRPGHMADLVVLDDGFAVDGVLRGGHWLRPPAAKES